MTSRWVLFTILLCLAVFEGLLITMLSHWPSVLDTSKSRIQEALYVSSPVASSAYLFQPRQPRKLLLVVAVLSHAARKARRDAIRETWFSDCRQRTDEVFCAFFTDQAGLDNETSSAVMKESEENNDLVFLEVEDNLAFTERLLQAIAWSSQRLKFDFFLRIDDDHFLCLDRLLYELNYRPKQTLYWGFVHCRPKIVRVDEAWLMLTRDLIEETLEKRNSTLLCSPYGDQAVAIWMGNSSKNVTYFMDNHRIVHKSAGKDQKFFTKDVCMKYLSLHGTYPKAMRQLWLVASVFRQRTPGAIAYTVNKIEPFDRLCPHSPQFDYRGFIPEYQFKPKPCYENPKWALSKERHVGREETGERYSKYK